MNKCIFLRHFYVLFERKRDRIFLSPPPPPPTGTPHFYTRAFLASFVNLECRFPLYVAQLKGLLECGRSLRMEGTFQGDLISTGRVVVAPTGKIKGDLKGIKFLLVEGQVRMISYVIPLYGKRRGGGHGASRFLTD